MPPSASVWESLGGSGAAPGSCMASDQARLAGRSLLWVEGELEEH